MKEQTILSNFMKKIIRMQFIDVDELYLNIEEIKSIYNEELLNDDEKKIYKWYFFNQLCLLRWKSKTLHKQMKEVLWGYLNENEDREMIDALYKEFTQYRIELSKKKKKKP